MISYNTNIKKPETEINDAGILIKKDSTPLKKPVITLPLNTNVITTSKPVLTTSTPTMTLAYDKTTGLAQNPFNDGDKPPVRSANIPDSVWKNMVNTWNAKQEQKIAAYNSKTNEQKVEASAQQAEEVATTIKQTQAEQAAAAQKVAAISAAAANKAIKENKENAEKIIQAVQPPLPEITVSMNNLFQTMETAANSQQIVKDAGINATPSQKEQAAKDSIEALQAVSDAADKGAILPPSLQQTIVDNTVKTINEAKASGALQSDAIQLKNDVIIDNNKIPELVQKVSDEADKTAMIAAGNDPEINAVYTDLTQKPKVNFLDQLVNFIYNQIYS